MVSQSWPGLLVTSAVPVTLMSKSPPVWGATAATVVLLPMILPPVVAGVLMVYAFGTHGLVGHYLAEIGLGLPFTTFGVIAVQTFVSLPFAFVAAEDAFRATGSDLEDMAATLGASPWRIFWDVALPFNRRRLLSCAVMAWARALGEFGATITFAGNLAGRTRTMPLAISLAIQNDPVTATTLSMLLVAVSAVVLVAAQRLNRKEAG